MGLDTTHNAWHGPYSQFNNFRYWLAKRIGINLDDYFGYKSNGTKDLESIDHPLMDLFNHSDCDGELTPMQCDKIAAGLEQVMSDVTLDEMEDFDTQYFFERAEDFRRGCLLAAAKNESIIFQ